MLKLSVTLLTYQASASFDSCPAQNVSLMDAIQATEHLTCAQSLRVAVERKKGQVVSTAVEDFWKPPFEPSLEAAPNHFQSLSGQSRGKECTRHAPAPLGLQLFLS